MGNDLSALSGELKSLAFETFEVQDYAGLTEELMAGSTSCSSTSSSCTTSTCSSSTTSCCA